MIAISSFQVINWRNRYDTHPVAVAELDVGDGSWRVGGLSADAQAALTDRFPAVPQGDAAAVMAAICLALHREYYDVPAACGAEPSLAWFAAVDPFFASATTGLAVAFLNDVIDRPGITAAQLAPALDQLVRRAEMAVVDQSTRAMVTAAGARGIPWFRVHPSISDMQLGHGHRQRRLRETLVSTEGAIATTYSQNKPLSLTLLSAAGLPTGRFSTATNVEQAVATALAIGLPVVLKPTDRGKGVGVMVGLATPEAVRAAATTLLSSARQIMIQSFLHGDDHRLLVVDGRLVAAALRLPASVTGDGVFRISQLIDAANRDPRRGEGFRRLMNRIEVDDEVRRVLAAQGTSLDAIPAMGQAVRLRFTANISTGGSARDVTDQMHPDNVWLAERAAQIIGLKVAGVDLLIPDISRSWREVGGGICEINAIVGLRPHWLADSSRDVVGPILETIFPAGDNGRIPTALVTGSNGKTTVVRMVDHILRAAGHVVGSATTDSITVDGRMVALGDYAGSSGAAVVLREPSITAAALEAARGGVLKWGIGVEHCNVAAILNVVDEQVGIEGVETIEEMAALKRKVLETATDAFVLNAQDDRCLAIAHTLPAERTILFSLEGAAAGVAEHLAAGGRVVTLANAGGEEIIVIRDSAGETLVAAAAALPATFGGKVRFNVANALAATALAHGMGIGRETIAEGLMSFAPAQGHSPGRYHFVDDLPVRALFDFAHNPPAIEMLKAALESVPVTGRRICLVSSPGRRTDVRIDDCARAVAHHFDHYICFEREDWRRERAVGEISGRLADALIGAGVPAETVSVGPDQKTAMAQAVAVARPGDLIIVMGSDVLVSLPELREAFAAAGG